MVIDVARRSAETIAVGAAIAWANVPSAAKRLRLGDIGSNVCFCFWLIPVRRLLASGYLFFSEVTVEREPPGHRFLDLKRIA